MLGHTLGATAWILVLTGAAMASPTSNDLLGPATVVPPAAALIQLHPVAEPTAPGEDLAAQGRYLEANFDKLKVAEMKPELVVTTAQVLVITDHSFLAERLLGQAAAEWPEHVEVAKTWARLLIDLGRPDAAVRVLTTAIVQAPADATLHYLHARALLGRLPTKAQGQGEAMQALRTTLELAPEFTDPDGVSAAGLRQVISSLEARLMPTKNAPK